MADADQGTPDEWGAPLPESAPPGLARPGPDDVVPTTWGGDSWDATTGEGATVVVYEGRRRAQAPPARLTVVIGLAVLALVAAITLPLALSGSSDPPPSARDRTVVIDPRTDPESTSGTLPATGLISPATGLSTAAPRTSTTTTRPPATTTANPPPFTTITVEAEAGGSAVSLGGSAHSDVYAGASGGRIVFNIGDWNTRAGPGTITFRNIVIPTTGTYRLTLYYVHPDGDPSRSATVTVSGVSPVTLAFAGSATCCGTKTITLTIPAGTHTVTMANGSEPAPALDKMSISRP